MFGTHYYVYIIYKRIKKFGYTSNQRFVRSKCQNTSSTKRRCVFLYKNNDYEMITERRQDDRPLMVINLGQTSIDLHVLNY